MIDLIDLKWPAIPNSFHCFYGILSKNRDLAYFVIKRLHTKSWIFEMNFKIRIMYRLPKWNMITDKLTSFWDQLQVTIIVMSIEERFPPNSLSSFFVYEHSFIYSCVQWILYMPFVQKSSTHSYPHTLPTPTPTHTQHTPTSHPVTFTHNSLTHLQTPPPPTHRICTKWLPWKRVFFLLLLQKLTQSMHLDNKLDWVNQHSFQGIHFVFLLG